MSWVPTLPIVSLIVAWLGALAARAHARRHGMVDLPGPRRSHDAPTLRGGGLGIVAALAVPLGLLGAAGSVPAGWAIGAAGGVILVGTVGWVEDHRPLPPWQRLTVHGLAAAWLIVWVGGVAELDFGGFRLGLHWAGYVLPFLATMWLTNLYNFMDGMDGLAAGEGLFAGCLMALLFALSGAPGFALAGLCVAGASAGFMPWNLPRAKLFMGDVGSTTLGFAFAALALAGARGGEVPALLSLLVLGLFVYDATFTLIWRGAKGMRWYTAHREHAYQYLVRAGLDHATALRRLMGVNLLVILPVVLVLHRYSIILGPGVVVFSLAGAWMWRTVRRRCAGSPEFSAATDDADGS